MIATIFKVFHFESAHYLPRVPTAHKCSNMHGHSYSVEIHCRGEVSPEFGWVADFSSLVDAFESLRRRLDHHCLNNIEGLENPTSERLAEWLWERLFPSLPLLSQIVVSETANSGCIYNGPGNKESGRS